MFGYNTPRKHDLRSIRVIVCESEVGLYMDRFPMLTREQVLVVMVTSGPMRKDVELELSRLAASADSYIPLSKAPKRR
jgi:hypothetical protein